MSKKFVRNITDIEEIEKQEKDTNIQNDILSTNSKDVYIRTGNIYHELTNKVKNVNISNHFNDKYNIVKFTKSTDDKKNIYIRFDFLPLIKELEGIDKKINVVYNEVLDTKEKAFENERNIKKLQDDVEELKANL